MADESVTLDSSRRLLALDAVWELDKIARVLPGLVPLDEDQNHYAVRALAGRMIRLTGALMSAIGEPEIKTSELDKVINFHDAEISQG